MSSRSVGVWVRNVTIAATGRGQGCSKTRLANRFSGVYRLPSLDGNKWWRAVQPLAQIRKRFMPVRIRLKRIGAKNKPAFRVVVADGRSPRDGRFIEEIGTYLPQKKGEKFTLDLERAKYWVSKGAQPSETVASFIKKAAKAAAAAPAA
jgi:small subunit ribosomal protein S16